MHLKKNRPNKLSGRLKVAAVTLEKGQVKITPLPTESAG